MAHINLVEATIEDLQHALSSGALTSVELVAKYLYRIAKYDARGICLNSIPILNEKVFEEAAASDDYRASGNPPRRLEGIPYTVKDSFKVKGMTVAAGSPSFRDLIATEDAFTVSAIRAEGGVMLGRTNMPPMAYGGMQRGIYGRAESPYNENYLAAAFASGSSNGSAVATASSFAAFGMGEETVSSGRSPASNNALIAYTPSRGWISIRGNWPLYPTCDVVVPHTRTMKDLSAVLEVIMAEDPSTKGDFWRDQPFVQLAKPWQRSQSKDLLGDITTHSSLQGLRIAVPQMYVGTSPSNGAIPLTITQGTLDAWESAREALESIGAEIIIVPDFPAVTAYENPQLIPNGSPRLPERWQWTERGSLVAHGWDYFLRSNADPNISSLKDVDEFNIYPYALRTPAELENLPQNNAIHWGELNSYLGNGHIYEIPKLADAVVALEGMRESLLDDYLKRVGCDCFAFPAAGDVGAADADISSASAAHAWKNGVFYSNGNRALRHLGIPSVTVPMGMISEKQMPIGLTFAGRANDDVNLLKWANAYEKTTKLRSPPPRTPMLPSDRILSNYHTARRVNRPSLTVVKCCVLPTEAPDTLELEISGSLKTALSGSEDDSARTPAIQIIVDGEAISSELIQINDVTDGTDQAVVQFHARAIVTKPPMRCGRADLTANSSLYQTMVLVLASLPSNSQPAGYLKMA